MIDHKGVKKTYLRELGTDNKNSRCIFTGSTVINTELSQVYCDTSNPVSSTKGSIFSF